MHTGSSLQEEKSAAMKPSLLLNALERPYYETDLGAAFLGDSKEFLCQLPDASVNLIMTSPPPRGQNR